jgi:methyltransferase (TIGR00027 family)
LLSPLTAEGIPLQDNVASVTARIAALARYAHSLEPDSRRIFNDPYAAAFLGGPLRTVVRSAAIRRLMRAYFDRKLPGAYGEVGARTAYIDEYVLSRVQKGASQIVILGAGYDCRAYRLQELERVRVFEVDHPATQRAKEQIVERTLGSLPRHVSYVGVDFQRDSVHDKLTQSGYDHGRMTAFVWEAVTRYLSAAAVDETLRFVSSNTGEGTSILFDYIYGSLLRSGSTEAKKWVRYFESQMQEPYTFAIEEGQIGAFMSRRGFRNIHNVDARYMEATYFKPAGQSIKVNRFFGWVTAEVGSEGTPSAERTPVTSDVKRGDLRDQIDILGRVPMLEALTREQLEHIRRSGQIVDFEPGHEITREGDDTRDFYILLQGEALVTLRLDKEHGVIDAGTVGPLETLGELALLIDEPRTATVTATRPVTALRLDAATFLRLYRELPEFGLAVSRELARRLETTYRQKHVLNAALSGTPIKVQAPDLTHTRSYMSKYYSTVLRNVLGSHQLLTEARFPTYQSQLRVSREDQKRWFELLGATEAEERAPFPYYIQNGTFVLMNAVNEIGINFRHLLHLKVEMAIATDGPPLQPETDYTTTSRVVDMIHLSKDRVALVWQSRFERDGQLVMTMKDYFAILNIAPEYVEALKNNERYGMHDAAQFAGIRKREAKLRSAPLSARVTFPLEPDTGVRFGRVSGDMNPVHTNRLAARMFGYPRPFVQGLYTASMVLKTLTGRTTKSLSGFSIIFCNPAFLEQTMTLAWSDAEFEVWDEQDTIVACGEYR